MRVYLSADIEGTAVNPSITTVPVLKGIGNSSVSLHPIVAVRAIRDGAGR